jgi:hypothetical protein
MPLSYLRADGHKQAITYIWESQRFESMYTLQGKTRPTRHTYPTLHLHMVSDHTYLTWSTRSNHSRSPHEVEIDPCNRKKSWRPKTDWPSRRLRSPHSSSLTTVLEYRKEVSAKWLHSYIGLLGPYTSMRSVLSIVAHGGQRIDP